MRQQVRKPSQTLEEYLLPRAFLSSLSRIAAHWAHSTFTAISRVRWYIPFRSKASNRPARQNIEITRSAVHVAKAVVPEAYTIAFCIGWQSSSGATPVGFSRRSPHVQKRYPAHCCCSVMRVQVAMILRATSGSAAWWRKPAWRIRRQRCD